MNRADLCKEFSEKYGVSMKESETACKNVLDLLAECVDREDRVYICGFGTFKKKTQKTRTIGDLNGGTKQLPEKEKVVFEPTVRDRKLPAPTGAMPVFDLDAAIEKKIKELGIVDMLKRLLQKKTERVPKVAPVTASREKKKICKHCGEAFVPAHYSQRYCSAECRHEGDKASKRATYYRKRDREKKAPAASPATVSITLSGAAVTA